MVRTVGAARPECVLFDFGGTLDADGETWKARVHRLLQDEGLTVPAARFDSLFYAADDALVGTVPSTLSFLETVRRLVAGVATGLAYGDDALVQRVATRFVGDAQQALQRNASVLTSLRRRYRIGLVSNFYGNLDAVCGECGIRELFSVVIDSTRIGLSKPDPAIFRAALHALEVWPAAATFVGDSLLRDMAGARAVGMPHVWLAGLSSVGPPCCPGDAVVQSVKGLEDLLL